MSLLRYLRGVGKTSDKEIDEIEQTQEALRESIEQAKQLADKAQMLLQKHKKKSKLSPTDPAFDIRVSTFVAEPLARLSFQRGYVSRRRAYDGYSTVGRPHLYSDVRCLTCAHADCLEKIDDLDLFSALKYVLTQIKQAESLHACTTFGRSNRNYSTLRGAQFVRHWRRQERASR